MLVSRPVTVVTLFLTILGTGLLAYLKIPLTYTPSGLYHGADSFSYQICDANNNCGTFQA